jgi:hypothetical protein
MFFISKKKLKEEILSELKSQSSDEIQDICKRELLNLSDHIKNVINEIFSKKFEVKPTTDEIFEIQFNDEEHFTKEINIDRARLQIQRYLDNNVMKYAHGVIENKMESIKSDLNKKLREINTEEWIDALIDRIKRKQI